MRRALLCLLLLLGCSPDWSRKDAHRRCRGAIAAYPGRAAPPCEALRMCANEAQLSADEAAKLKKMAEESGCAPF